MGSRSGRFAGKSAVVTGAGAGIGRAAAIEFAQEDARLVITGAILPVDGGYLAQ